MSKTTNLALRPSEKLKRGASDAPIRKKDPATAHPSSESSVSKMNIAQSATANPPKEKSAKGGKRSFPEEESTKERPSNRGKLTVRHSLAWWDPFIKHVSHYEYDVPPHPANKNFEAPPESYGHDVTFTTKPAPGRCPLPCHGYVVKWDVEERPPPPTVDRKAPLLDLPSPKFVRPSLQRTMHHSSEHISTDKENGRRIFRLLASFSSSDDLSMTAPDTVKFFVERRVFNYNSGKVLQVRYFVEGKGPYLDLPCDPRHPFNADVLVECGPTDSFLKAKEYRGSDSPPSVSDW